MIRFNSPWMLKLLPLVLIVLGTLNCFSLGARKFGSSGGSDALVPYAVGSGVDDVTYYAEAVGTVAAALAGVFLYRRKRKKEQEKV